MTQFVGIEGVPAQRDNESQGDDFELKEYLNRYAPYVEAYAESKNLDIDAKVDAYRELINDYQLLKTDLEELKSNPDIKNFLGQKPQDELPAHDTLEAEVDFYLTISGSKELATFKAEQAAIEAEKSIRAAEEAYLRSRADAKARIDKRLGLVVPVAKQPAQTEVAPIHTSPKIDNESDDVDVPEVQSTSDKLFGEQDDSEQVVEFSEVKLKLVDETMTPARLKDNAKDIALSSLKYAKENRTKAIAASAAALSLVGMLATLPTKNTAEEKGRIIANSITGSEAFFLDEPGPVAQATINEIVSVKNTEKSVDAAQKLRDFTNAAKASIGTQPSITIAKPNAKFSVEFLEIFADETAKESVNLGLPIAVQNSVQANADLLKVIAHHPTILKKDALTAIATPENEFQTELTDFLGTEGIIQDPTVYSQEQQEAILGVIARIYDLSNDAKQEKVIITEAEKNAQDNLKDLEADRGSKVVPPAQASPELPNNGRLSGEALQAAESQAADRAYLNRAKDLVNQFSNDKWPNGTPVKPLDAQTLVKIIKDTHAKYGHDIFGPKAALAQLAQESKFDLHAGSRVGAEGIAQFMPDTWKEWGKGKDINDPVAAIDAQFRYMIYITDRLDNKLPALNDSQILKLALAGYNAGPFLDSIEAGQVPDIKETKGYVKNILKMMARTNEWIDAAVNEVQELNMTVPKGARDLGIHKGYSNGIPVNLHLVGIPGMKSSSDESDKTNKYYVEGANGEAIVNIRIAAQLLELQKAAADDGIDLSLVSSYRTHQHQKDLWDANPNRAVVAEPGHSNHQQGVAVDFNLNGLPITASYYNTANGLKVSHDNPRVAPESKTWKWLDENAKKFGLEQYYNEPWHYSPGGH